MINDSSSLFSPLKMGDITLKNRIVMAPLTRNRATHGTDAPNELMVEYYRQRATAGLIITEATQISQQGQGYTWTPGIYTEAQVEGWTKVTEALHKAGGHMFMQLWHVGRISHNSLQKDNGAPVAPSAIKAKGKTYTETGFTDVSEPRALETDEIPGIVQDYVKAARNAIRAGMDGVEIHAANGYLLDQFMRDGTNKRDDIYGGSIENRIRFTLDVVDAVIAAISASKVGIRISPVSPANDCHDSNPTAVFMALTQELAKRKLGYLHVVEGATGGPRDVEPFDYAALKYAFDGIYMGNNAYDRDMALEAVSSGEADLVAFGKPFIANPDLVERLRIGADLNIPDDRTFYGGGAEGYTDYPFLQQKAAE